MIMAIIASTTGGRRRLAYTAAMTTATDWNALAQDIKRLGMALGFQQVGITLPDLGREADLLREWLARGWHGTMGYMERHAARADPQALVPGTLRVICARMDYLPEAAPMQTVLEDGNLAYVARYALGRDYHKLVRKRLQKLTDRVGERIGAFGYRVFCDSAPVMEKPLARNAGLGWIGKHTNLINHRAGSWFFLGEIYTDLPLPVDRPASDHCGSCSRCLEICPTQAIVAPYQLDARRCIAYLTIEHAGPIPVALRQAIGNRIYGCDDCQLVCPWNKFARHAAEPDFRDRHGLGSADLVRLFLWSEDEFLAFSEGSAIRRIGYERWLRNLAVALGNAPTGPAVLEALRQREWHASALVREHVAWALQRHGAAPAAVAQEPAGSSR